MKYTTLQHDIEVYKGKMGLGRTYGSGVESHIADLEKFAKEVAYHIDQQDNIPEAALPELVRILLSKTSAGQASSNCIEGLCKRFGGTTVLSDMSAAGLATPDYLAFLERHSEHSTSISAWLRALATRSITLSRESLSLLENLQFPNHSFPPTFTHIMGLLRDHTDAHPSIHHQVTANSIFSVFAELKKLGIPADRVIFGSDPANTEVLLPSLDRLYACQDIVRKVAIYRDVLSVETLQAIWRTEKEPATFVKLLDAAGAGALETLLTNNITSPAQLIAWLEVCGPASLELLLKHQNNLNNDHLEFLRAYGAHLRNMYPATVTFLTLRSEVREQAFQAWQQLCGTTASGATLQSCLFNNLSDAQDFSTAWFEAAARINTAFTEQTPEMHVLVCSAATQATTYPKELLKTVGVLGAANLLDADRLKRLCDAERAAHANTILTALQTLVEHEKLDATNADSVMIDAANGLVLARELCGIKDEAATPIEAAASSSELPPAQEQAAAAEPVAPLEQLTSPTRTNNSIFVSPGSPSRLTGSSPGLAEDTVSASACSSSSQPCSSSNDPCSSSSDPWSLDNQACSSSSISTP